MGGTEGVRDPLGIGKRDDEGTGGIRQRVGAEEKWHHSKERLIQQGISSPVIGRPPP